MVKLLDAYGRPVDLAELKTPVAFPRTVSGIYEFWGDSVADGMTPGRLATVLRAAAEGDGDAYLVLAEEMEERNMHYASVLRTRKLAVSGLEVTVEAASDDAQDVRLADDVRQLVRQAEFANLVDDLLDALGKGYSAAEILWDTSARQWAPKGYLHHDPRVFQFHPTTGLQIRVGDPAQIAGQPLPPYRLIVHLPRLKSGVALRGGLARLAAWEYLVKTYTIKDWVSFVEVFGHPIRLGKYAPGATPEDQAKLKRAVMDIGHQAAGIMPSTMDVQLIDVNRGTGNDTFERLADWCDNQMSLAVLGQTASTKGTPGKLGNDNLQSDVRKDLTKADGRQLAATLTRDLVKPYIDLNYGPQAAYPRIQILLHEPEDIAALADALQKLVPLGLRVETSVIRDKLGLPDPEDGAEVLGVAAPLNTPGMAQNTASGMALNQATQTPETDDLDALA